MWLNYNLFIRALSDARLEYLFLLLNTVLQAIPLNKYGLKQVCPRSKSLVITGWQAIDTSCFDKDCQIALQKGSTSL